MDSIENQNTPTDSVVVDSTVSKLEDSEITPDSSIPAVELKPEENKTELKESHSPRISNNEHLKTEIEPEVIAESVQCENNNLELNNCGEIKDVVKNEDDNKTEYNSIDSERLEEVTSMESSPPELSPAMIRVTDHGEIESGSSGLNSPPTLSKSVSSTTRPIPSTDPIELPVPNRKPASVSNGVRLSGKPKAYAIDRKKVTKSRGRSKRKALIPMYQSQISDNKIGIKLKLKKSDTSDLSFLSSKSSALTAVLAGSSSGSSRKRIKRKTKHKDDSNSDDSDYERHRKRTKTNNNTLVRKEIGNSENYVEPAEQSIAAYLPEDVLIKIFHQVVDDEGSLPSLVRLGRVCKSWNRASLCPSLWRNLDLATWTKERWRTEIKLKWLLENRAQHCKEINIGHWKIANVQCVLDRLYEGCSDLQSLTIAGWKGLTSEHLTFIVESFKSLNKIDLSSINMENNNRKSAVGLQSLSSSIGVLGDRLTHLYLAHNKLAGISQIIKALYLHCPNLILLDLSNVKSIVSSHSVLDIEGLQQGCKKLKVLRITNSNFSMNSAPLEEQMKSEGFPDLEELSVASLSNNCLVDDNSLLRILKTSTNLTLLDVRGCLRLSHESLIRLPAWDLKHLFLSGCSITRDSGTYLELIASKWAHSLVELDLAWATVTAAVDGALVALAEKGKECPLAHLNICGSAVSQDAVKEVLKECPSLQSINLSSCRGLPRGVKRLLQSDKELTELKETLGVIEKQIKDEPPVDVVEKATAVTQELVHS